MEPPALPVVFFIQKNPGEAERSSVSPGSYERSMCEGFGVISRLGAYAVQMKILALTDAYSWRYSMKHRMGNTAHCAAL